MNSIIKPDILDETWLSELDESLYHKHADLVSHWLECYRNNGLKIPHKDQLEFSKISRMLEHIKLSRIVDGKIDYFLTGSGTDEFTLRPLTKDDFTVDYTDEFYDTSCYVLNLTEQTPAICHGLVYAVRDTGQTFILSSMMLPLIDRERVVCLGHLAIEKGDWLPPDHEKIEPGKMALYKKRHITVLDITKIK